MKRAARWGCYQRASQCYYSTKKINEEWVSEWKQHRVEKTDLSWFAKHVSALILDSKGNEERWTVGLLKETKDRWGLKTVIDLRTDLLDYLGDKSAGRAIPLNQRHDLVRFGETMRKIFSHWCSIDKLALRQISPDASSLLLQNLLKYEGVHPMKTVEDVKQRLGYGKRCYGLFHSTIPDLPLTFVHCALMPSITSYMKDILNYTESEDKANTAVFYSINSTQKGLSGVSLGNYLIKSAAKKLHEEHANLKNFVTLSPIPGYCSWLKSTLSGKSLFSSDEASLIQPVLSPSDEWHQNAKMCELLKPILMKACEHYLVKEKRGTSIYALDPVANFHLSNGASIEKLNWMADLSARRLKESAGIMVNYKYSLTFDGKTEERKKETNEKEEESEESEETLMKVLEMQKQTEESKKKENRYVETGEIQTTSPLW